MSDSQTYRENVKKADELRAAVPTKDLMMMAANGFLLAEDELTEVIRRLGERQRDLEDLLSVAKSLEVLSRKVRRLSERLMPEAADAG